MTNTISRINKYNIEIFPDLICAVPLDTSRPFVASVFDKPLVLRIHGNLHKHRVVVTSLEYIVTTNKCDL